MSNDGYESLIEYCRENGRVCPLPQKWNELWEMLPNRVQKSSGGWEPSLPLILAAWHETPALPKMIRLDEHIKWAQDQNALDEISVFLRQLREDEWFHTGD